MDTHSFIIHIKVYDICMELICQIRFVKYCFLLKKNDKGIGFTRDELGGKTMKEIVALRPRVYSCLQIIVMLKKSQGTQSFVINDKSSLETTKNIWIENDAKKPVWI